MIMRRLRNVFPVGLSARLLALTVAFVMVAEVLIYVPSISRFRKVWLEDQIEKANIAVLAVRANPEERIGKSLAMKLLWHAGAYAIAMKTRERRLLMLSKEMPPNVDITIDVDGTSMWGWISGAFTTLLQDENRVMRVLAPAPGQRGATLEVLIDEEPLRADMLAYSGRILQLSIVISLISASLMFLSLRWLLVRPIKQVTANMTRFRADPEDETTPLPQTHRSDEIGVLQRELAAMQTDLRAALNQKAHLAALGAAVARINHDLRNILSTALLTSDRLTTIDDPEVKRLAPRLLTAIDRAAALCSRTLSFVQGTKASLQRSNFRLADLVAELEKTVADASIVDAPSDGGVRQTSLTIYGDGLDVELTADRDQLFRVFCNLAFNAAKAGAGALRIDANTDHDRTTILVSDNGPGISDTVRPHLFQPFAITNRDGGSGLGLAIAREIMSAHGGELVLDATGPEGTIFRLELPRTVSRRERRAA